MIFAFFEEIDGSPRRAERFGTGGEDRLLSAVARERAPGEATRKMSQLEEHFGVRLFHRTTRKLSLNDDGQMLLGLARPILDVVKAMEVAVGRQSA
jgi:DNA-binding transcriptional LysR family regulator